MKKMYSNNPNSIKTIFLVSFLLLSIQNISAQIKVPFEQRTSAVSPDRKIYNIKGDYTMFGNTNLTLVNYGDETSNNNPMRYVDVDGDATTWNSSSSTLTFASENGSIPACSNIIYAGLYWTGRASNGSTSPDVFDYTRSVNANVPINQNYTVGHNTSIANTTYNMQITRGGTTNTTRFPIYSFTNGTDIYVFSYTNNTGANRVTLSINNGTPINIPVTVSGTTTLTATFVTPYAIANGNVTLTINSLERSSATNLSVGNTESTSFAGVNVSGTIPGQITETKTFDKRVVKIKGPNSTTYSTVTANFDPLAGAYDIYYPQNGDGFMYSAYAEITDYVKTNGLGSYTLADLALIEGDGGGTGYYGGWGIIVVYENSKMKWRDVTIFDGHSYVAGGITADFEIPVNGFNTVQAGPVNMKLGLMCGEGDRGIPGDFFQIRNHQDTAWTTLNHTGNSTNNFFNSSISTGGNTRNPNLLNNTGLDISMFNVPNPGNTIITNSQTSTKFRYGTTQDTFIIFTVAMSVDAYIPEVPGAISTTLVNNLPPVGLPPYTVLPGEEIEYEVVLYNTGSEATSNNVMTIPIPHGSTYVPNSIVNTLNYTPAPAVNSAVFNPLSGGNGSIIWNISEIPLPASPTTILGTIRYKLRATTDCAILTNPNCNASIITQGTTSGVGNVSQIPYNLNFILGYNTSGACINEPISGNLVTTINATNYINQNCQNTPLEYVFNYCSITGSIPVSLISSTFPAGTTFYNQFPVTTGTTQYTSTNPFPGTIGTSTYYAVPPNAAGCFFVFNIVISNDFAVTQPSTVNLNGCTVASIPVLPYSATPVIITPTQFINAGGIIVNQSLIISISYSDTIIGTCPLVVRRNYVINTACNNTPVINLTQTFTISDTTAPSISQAGANTTVQCPGTPSFTAPTATDNCGTATVNVVSTVTTPGNCAGNYSVTRTWNAIDACGNASAPVSQTITVQDNSAPTITAAGANATIDCTATPSFTAPTATDTCGTATVNIVSTITTPGNCAGNYTITRTWNATDDCGNASAPVSQTITVQDTTAPTISIQASNIIVDCDGQGNQNSLTAWLNSNGGASANDLCSDVTWTNNFTPNASNCSDAIIVVFTATDQCNNFATTSATFTIQDILAPVVPTAPADVTVSCADEVPAMVSLTALDNCSDEITVEGVDSIVQGDCPNSFTITRTWTFVDACQNTSSVSQTIIVNDELAPTLVGNLVAEINANCLKLPEVPVLQFVDNCSNTVTVVYTETPTEITETGTYSIIRTWTVSDVCGNTATFTQTVNVTISDYILAATLEEVCNEDIDLTVNLNTALVTLFPTVPAGGTWIDTSNTGSLVNGVFSPFEISVGTYTFTYEYGTAACPQIVVLTIDVNDDCFPLPCAAIIVHNAFSPNGDEFNETFFIENITDSACYSEIKVEIFNRWGIKVYDAQNYDNDKIVFKGISEGRSTLNASEMLPAGVYFYVLEYKNAEGNYVTKNGYLYLSR
jgi:gliding motility-associated-like protein